MTESVHSAAPNAVGYQHQTWWALAELLRAGATRPDSSLCLELFDDIAWMESGSPTELLQVKHRRDQNRSLTDRSRDFWKTIQVWLDEASPADPDGPKLFLVTTQVAAGGSAVAALRSEPDARDEQRALGLLEAIADSGGAEETAEARRAFMELPKSARRAFVGRIVVADGSPHADEVYDVVRQLLHWTLPKGQEDAFLALVWRWWDSQALTMLQGQLVSVDVGAAQAAIAEIRDRFTNEDLPTLVQLSDVDAAKVTTEYQSRRFVAQMNWVAYPPRNLERLVVDYYRAYTQAVLWVETDLIGLDELARFEEELIDEWEREFEWMTDTLADKAAEDAKTQAGRDLLRELMARTGITVRSRYNESFFARGHRHALADSGRIGWHPDFEEKLADLLRVDLSDDSQTR